ncbi:hypothetical protein [Ruminococcus sp.]|uniref:hypothetical protein n=1 Tax=Ruminococcus sp. TaxID=41978 RepID=UPI0025D26AA7|nr:hypothetical protein [Ruminococcus sp.]MBR1431648.1 hypothetical protein [Ruminococcus sp.]
MEGFKTVVSIVYRFANVPLTFGTFRFSIWQSWIGLAAIGMIIGFIKNVFSD